MLFQKRMAPPITLAHESSLIHEALKQSQIQDPASQGQHYLTLFVNPGLPHYLLASDGMDPCTIRIVQRRSRRIFTIPLCSKAKFAVQSCDKPPHRKWVWRDVAMLRIARREVVGKHSLALYDEPDALWTTKERVDMLSGIWASEKKGWWWTDVSDCEGCGTKGKKEKIYELIRNEKDGKRLWRVGRAEVSMDEDGVGDGFLRGSVSLETDRVDVATALVGLFVLMRWKVLWERSRASKGKEIEQGEGEDKDSR